MHICSQYFRLKYYFCGLQIKSRMKKIKIGLLARIVIAIILGIAIGTFFPGSASANIRYFQRHFQRVSQFLYPADYRRTGNGGYCRHRKRCRKNAARDGSDCLFRHPVFGIPLLLHRSHRVSVTHRTGSAA